jgi:IS30 family transposase
MSEEIRHEIVRRHQEGASIRQIARELGLARQTVSDTLRRWQAERAAANPTGALPAQPQRRSRLLDAYDDAIRQWLERSRLLRPVHDLADTGQ